MQPYFGPTRKTTSQKNQKQVLKKWKIEDNLNFKAFLLGLFNNKTSKTNGFDTIEIDLVSSSVGEISLQTEF